MDFDEALQCVVHKKSRDLSEYLDACRVLIEGRDKLDGKVYISVPSPIPAEFGMLRSVIELGSEERCNCGCMRVISPIIQRYGYEPGALEFTLDAEHPKCYLKPIGGFKSATYCMLELHVKERAVEVVEEPFAPFVFSLDALSTKGFNLEQIDDLLKKRQPGEHLPYVSDMVPVFSIRRVTLGDAASITILPDKDVEVLMEEPQDDVACASFATKE